ENGQQGTDPPSRDPARFCRQHRGDCSMSNVAKKSAERGMTSETDGGSAPAAARRRASELASEIARHERLYYGEGRPEITDSEFDALLRELVALEEKYPDLVTPDSPARRVGGAPMESFATVSHGSPMLSLENAYSWEEAQGWLARLRRAVPGAGPTRDAPPVRVQR